MDGTLINVCYSMKHFVPQDKDKGDELLPSAHGAQCGTECPW